jgi:hypothetical protein
VVVRAAIRSRLPSPARDPTIVIAPGGIRSRGLSRFQSGAGHSVSRRGRTAITVALAQSRANLVVESPSQPNGTGASRQRSSALLKASHVPLPATGSSAPRGRHATRPRCRRQRFGTARRYREPFEGGRTPFSSRPATCRASFARTRLASRRRYVLASSWRRPRTPGGGVLPGRRGAEFRSSSTRRSSG